MHSPLDVTGRGEDSEQHQQQPEHIKSSSSSSSAAAAAAAAERANNGRTDGRRERARRDRLAKRFAPAKRRERRLAVPDLGGPRGLGPSVPGQRTVASLASGRPEETRQEKWQISDGPRDRAAFSTISNRTSSCSACSQSTERTVPKNSRHSF